MRFWSFVGAVEVGILNWLSSTGSRAFAVFLSISTAWETSCSSPVDRGSDFSFFGEGTKPIFTGSEPPLNQLASFADFECVGLLPSSLSVKVCVSKSIGSLFGELARDLGGDGSLLDSFIGKKRELREGLLVGGVLTRGGRSTELRGRCGCLSILEEVGGGTFIAFSQSMVAVFDGDCISRLDVGGGSEGIGVD